jgi:hypothetical protein
MKLRVGQVCAACVPDSETNGTAWIITRIERALPSGSYVLRDEYSQNPPSDQYTVPANRITHFPAVNKIYTASEKVLALWYDEEAHEWSTMFYEATVIKTEGKRITIQFLGNAPLQVETDESRLTRFPVGFDGDAQGQEIAEASPPQSPTDPPREVKVQRRVLFTAGASGAGIAEFVPISDSDLSQALRPHVPVERLRSVEGTPLIDLLNDPGLFMDPHFHCTMNGSLRVTLPAGNGKTPALLNRDAYVGRLSRILHDWRGLDA